MAKRIKVLVLATVLVFTFTVVTQSQQLSYAADTTTSATAVAPTPYPTTPVKPTTPTKPGTTAPAKPAAPEVAAPVFSIPTITRVLHFGTTGPDVELLQKYLVKLGHDILTDGMFGNNTLAAVKAFQTKSSLTVDGYVGVKTNEALFTAANGTDAVTTASLVDDVTVLEKSIGTEGTWIITTLKDLVTENELVLDGVFKNGKQDKVTGEDVIQRKIGLYTQDADHNVTASFTLTAPKLTIKSPNARIQSGTFIGDIFVDAENFALVKAIVKGNIYFTNQAAKDTFTMDENSWVSGEKSLVELEADAIASASLVNTADGIVKGIGTEGAWILSIYKDIVTDQELVMEGDFLNSRDASQRKLALYSQDEDRNITRNFTLTAPKLTVLSPDARIQGGIFKGDVYVLAINFQLVKATVDGNIYFATEEAKASFDMDEFSAVTGMKALSEVDAVTTASLVRDADALQASMLNDGQWITAILNDITTDKNLFIIGEFNYKELVQRKLALYSQDENHAVTRRFTLTAPKLVVNSPNTRVEKGNFVGDLYVSAPNFKLNVAEVTGDIYVSPFATGFTMVKTQVTGNIYYRTQAVMDAAVIDDLSTVSGVQEIAN